VKLEGKDKADIVLGLDTNLTAEAAAPACLRRTASPRQDHRARRLVDPSSCPYDYGYFAVVYDSEKMKPPPPA
jgi:thiamine transport system substrate-binding protein